MFFLRFFLVQGRKEKSKYGYVVRKNLDFDKAELLLYEPVEKMPPFSRKTLVFVSPPGIPKQPLVHKLVDSNNDMFARPIPCKPTLTFLLPRTLKDTKFFISICLTKSNLSRIKSNWSGTKKCIRKKLQKRHDCLLISM